MPEVGETVATTSQLRAVLQQMDPYEFEQFVADLWTRMGWNTEVSTAAGDKGVDVIARQSMPYEQLLLIQAKRYGPNTTVGSPDVQQYASLRQQFEGVDKVLIVTTNEFTKQAKETADQLNVKLIDGDRLAHLIEEHEALDLVAEYLDFIEPIENAAENQATAETTHEEQPADASADSTTNDSILSTSSTSSTDISVSTLWQKGIWVCLIGWAVAIISVSALPDVIWGLLFFGSWLGLPVTIFLDALKLREVTDWPQFTWAYVIGSAIWFVSILVGGIYLWQRRTTVA
jgi:hypothetical protein